MKEKTYEIKVLNSIPKFRRTRKNGIYRQESEHEVEDGGEGGRKRGKRMDKATK